MSTEQVLRTWRCSTFDCFGSRSIANKSRMMRETKDTEKQDAPRRLPTVLCYSAIESVSLRIKFPLCRFLSSIKVKLTRTKRHQQKHTPRVILEIRPIKNQIFLLFEYLYCTCTQTKGKNRDCLLFVDVVCAQGGRPQSSNRLFLVFDGKPDCFFCFRLRMSATLTTHAQPIPSYLHRFWYPWSTPNQKMQRT